MPLVPQDLSVQLDQLVLSVLLVLQDRKVFKEMQDRQVLQAHKEQLAQSVRLVLKERKE